VGSLAKIETLGGTFYGVCLTPQVDVELDDGQILQLPTDCIVSIGQDWEYSDGLFRTRGIRVQFEIIDGSRHALWNSGGGEPGGIVRTEALSFLAIGGPRDVRFARWSLRKGLWKNTYELDAGSRLREVTGVLPKDIDRVRNGVRRAIVNNREHVAALMPRGQKQLKP
jgi:hypothetical protein